MLESSMSVNAAAPGCTVGGAMGGATEDRAGPALAAAAGKS